MYHSTQGNLGLSKAIDYFTSRGMMVAIPLNDTQQYDLVAEIKGRLMRVSVKTGRYKTPAGTYEIGLRSSGGGARGVNGKARAVAFDNTSCDYIFIYTSNNDLYLIPSKKITATRAIAVGNKYVEFKVKCLPFSEWVDINVE